MSHDSLSALLDGECDEAELNRLLEEWHRSPELAQRWSRMCMAREAEQGTRILKQQTCICAGVMGALGEQPAADGKVVDLAVHKASRLSGPRVQWNARWKPAAGLAAAAALGAAAVLVLRPASQGEGISPVAVNVADASPTAEEEAYRQMLREYVMDHSNSVADEGLGGPMRYARFAAHTAAYRPASDE